MDPNIFKVVRPCLWFAAGDVIHLSMLAQYFTAEAVDDLKKFGYLSQDKQLLPPSVFVLYGANAIRAYQQGIPKFLNFARKELDAYMLSEYPVGTQIEVVLEEANGWEGYCILPPKDYEEIVAAIG